MAVGLADLRLKQQTTRRTKLKTDTKDGVLIDSSRDHPPGGHPGHVVGILGPAVAGATSAT